MLGCALRVKFAVPGGVMLSDSAYDQIKNRNDVGVVRLGRFRLKNVGRPFELYAVSAAGVVVVAAESGETRASRLRALSAERQAEADKYAALAAAVAFVACDSGVRDDRPSLRRPVSSPAGEDTTIVGLVGTMTGPDGATYRPFAPHRRPGYTAASRSSSVKEFPRGRSQAKGFQGASG